MTNHESTGERDSEHNGEHNGGSSTAQDSAERGDPRLGEPTGHEGMPAEVIDTAHNMPGDQPEDGTPPSRTRATGRD